MNITGKDLKKLPPVKEIKKVLIIGGGPAGMQAAITASARGHEVTLIEKNSELGGMPGVIARADRSRKSLWRSVRSLERKAKACADVRTGITADADFITGFGADVTLIATGSIYNKPDKLEGYENLTDIRLAYTQPPENKKILITGGGLFACETAIYLQKIGCETTIVLYEKAPEAGSAEVVRNDLRRKMEKAGVKTVYEAHFRKVSSGEVECVFPGDSIVSYKGDIIYGSFGSRSQDELYRELILSGLKLYAIGDSATPGTIENALQNAYETAVKIGT